MGNKFANSSRADSTEVRTLMVGLESAGKTTILQKLKSGEIVTTTPAKGFNVKTATVECGTNNIIISAWDVGGQGNMRALWCRQFENTPCLIFVIDSSDRERLDDAKEELKKLLSEEELKEACLLVFVNKKDLPNSMNAAEVGLKIGLVSFCHDRPWYVQSTCATSGEGLQEGFDWLSYQIHKKKN